MAQFISYTFFDELLSTLGQGGTIYGPVRQSHRGEFFGQDVIGYGPVSSAADLVIDRKSTFSPKELLFPVRETLFTFENERPKVPDADDRPFYLFLRACDIHGIDRLDRIFLQNGTAPDFYYERRRKHCRFFLIECSEGFETCFCVPFQTNRTNDFAAAFHFSPDGITVTAHDPELARCIEGRGTGVSHAVEFVNKNRIEVTLPPSGSVTNTLFEHPLWQEYTRRCIACGRCNTSCVTCSCFTMQDAPGSAPGQTMRRRRWAGCHVQGFTDMAGGVSYRKTNGERMRFKTLHKVSDFHKRFGVHMCVGCGRCDDNCPEHISFARCINLLSTAVNAGAGT